MVSTLPYENIIIVSILWNYPHFIDGKWGLESSRMVTHFLILLVLSKGSGGYNKDKFSIIANKPTFFGHLCVIIRYYNGTLLAFGDIKSRHKKIAICFCAYEGSPCLLLPCEFICRISSLRMIAKSAHWDSIP